eukprot:TRINITY_DN16023_c0_g1_i1.p1 TRINITY_DN16023_c0_g1~~TRINITY_DN16023_c0_g1_i1.p1  ORF type:complete len:254 (-),score=66.18 TRINITY_DN16023_c0_g1_i1:191-952(-)
MSGPTTSEKSSVVTPVEMAGAACCFSMVAEGNGPTTIALTAGETKLEDNDLAASVSHHIRAGRLKSASVAAVLAARKKEAKGHIAVACARLGLSQETAAATEKKDAKQQEVANKVRVRQVLLRVWSGKGPQPTNPVTRKQVPRKADEAEKQMVELLEKLHADGCKSFPSVAKASSECQSALKGGADCGDLGWLDQAKAAALAKAKGQMSGGPKSAVQSSVPASVLKAAFALQKGELSDLITSELGVHLLQRTA